MTHKHTQRSTGVRVSVPVLIFIIIFALIAGFIAGAQRIGARALPASVSASLYAKQPEGIDLSPVWKVWYLLDEKFVDPYYDEKGTTTKQLTDEQKRQERIWGMAEGLAASMGDPYTVFMPPSDNKMFNEDISGEFEGVGMEIGIRDGMLTVVSPLKGTPAYRAGIKAKDRITEIDGASTKGMGVNEAVKRIRGKRGTKVTLTILREGEGELKIDVVRDVIEIPTIKTRTLPTGEFVIELLHFSEPSPELFRKALIEFNKSGSKKLIIDLRGNPGGYLGAAVNIASWFLPEGAMVVTEDYGPGAKKVEHRSTGMNIFSDEVRIVVLVDKGSASASEILSGALKEHKRATLIGTNTFGKGSVQELVDITDETSLKVTVARWLLPNNVHIGKDGIEPDIKVDLKKLIEQRGGKKFGEDEDPILDRAVEFFKTGK